MVNDLIINEANISGFLRIMEPGMVIIEDCWRGYVNITKLGYVFFTANDIRNIVDQNTVVYAQAMYNRERI